MWLGSILCSVFIAQAGATSTSRGYIEQTRGGAYYFVRRPGSLLPRIPVKFASPRVERFACVNGRSPQRCEEQVFAYVVERKKGRVAWRELTVLSSDFYQRAQSKLEILGFTEKR